MDELINLQKGNRMSNLISRQTVVELVHSLYPNEPVMRRNKERWKKKYKLYIETEKALKQLPSAQPELDTALYSDGFNDGYAQCKKDAQSEIAGNLYQYKCYITDREGLQHEVIHTDDIRRITGWMI